jgi:hypothetical protein
VSWDRYFSEHLSFPCQYHFTNTPYSFIHSFIHSFSQSVSHSSIHSSPTADWRWGNASDALISSIGADIPTEIHRIFCQVIQVNAAVGLMKVTWPLPSTALQNSSSVIVLYITRHCVTSKLIQHRKITNYIYNKYHNVSFATLEINYYFWRSLCVGGWVLTITTFILMNVDYNEHMHWAIQGVQNDWGVIWLRIGAPVIVFCHPYALIWTFITLGAICIFCLPGYYPKIQRLGYRKIILPVVLYGCETWSLTLREERRLRVFENRVLRRIFWP